MRNSAELFLKNGVAAATAAYPAALAKYKKLISDCGGLASLKIVGLTDAAIALPAEGTTGIRETAISGANGTYATNSDLSTVITSATYPRRMAENFAIAEVLVSQGLSQSIALTSGYGGLYGMNYQNVLTFDTKLPGNGQGWWNPDEHTGGTYLSLIANSFMYQCLYSCINELINVVKAKNLFSETVIFVTGDFGRREESTDPGTAHASDACVIQAFSGAIAAPSVIGNISKGATSDHGQNRPVTNLGGANRALTIMDATSTIAGLARVSPPAENNPSLVDANGAPLIEKARELA